MPGNKYIARFISIKTVKGNKQRRKMDSIRIIKNRKANNFESLIDEKPQCRTNRLERMQRIERQEAAAPERTIRKNERKYEESVR